jgi:opacity protein-like surface antigen
MHLPVQVLTRSRLAAAVALWCLAGSARAELPGDSWWGELSYFYPTISSTARLDLPGTNRPGTVISLEDELDLADRKSTPYLQLGMRAWTNWRFEFEYYLLNRSASKSITRQIDWGDETFPAGATLDTKFDTSIYRLTAGYSFYRTTQAEAGVGFGLHVTDITTRLSGTGTVGGGTASFQNEGHDVLAPLPTVGLFGTYRFTDQLSVRGRADYLSLTIGDYHGRLTNAFGGLDWRFTKNVGAGVGYRYVKYNLRVEKSNFHGEVDYTFKGPTFFLNVGF